MPVLKLNQDDPQKEPEFEVERGLMISQEDRIQQRIELTQKMLRLENQYEDRRSFQIIKRPPD